MKKILVPTDFSANSKKGIRFAIHWATRQELELVFVHVLHMMRLVRWTDDEYRHYAEQEKKSCKLKFDKFIAGTYRQMNAEPRNQSNIIIEGIRADSSILDYCHTNPGFDCICISTRGAGALAKLLGTNTSNLITKSEVPVLAIPKNYKTADVTSVLYATDFGHYSAELEKVFAFAQPLDAEIEVLHLAWPGEPVFDDQLLEAAFKEKFNYDLTLHSIKNDVAHSLIDNLQHQINIRKPSVVIMFTDQRRTFFEKFFLSSQAEELSFQVSVPLLVFNKN